jgi:hypothetical protein
MTAVNLLARLLGALAVGMLTSRPAVWSPTDR